MLPYTSHIAKKLKGTATLLFLLFCVCSAVARDTTRVFSKLPWYEDDRLNLVAGDGYLSYYAYGYDGNRAIKMTGTATIDQNGTLTNTGELSHITIYPSEYLTVTQTEYTKFYYAGGNRIASKIGTGGFGKIQQLCTLDQNLTANANTLFDNILQQAVNTTNPPTDEYPVEVCNGYNVSNELLHSQLLDFYINSLNLNFTQNNLLQQFRQNLAGGTEPVYYFHSDHLGSASWITNNTGLPVQHLLYLPFGEHFVNERSAAYDERFTFTGKERDAETGYYYHGARFNSSDIGWLSVDPMSDKYPEITPYHYCHWNPIKLIDPDGRDEWDLNENGTMIWKKESDEDIIRAKNGTFVKVTDGMMNRGKSYVTAEDMTFNFGSCKNNAIEFFEFLADNTNVEWSLLGCKINDLYDNYYIFGSLDGKGEHRGAEYALELVQNGFCLFLDVHNHPDGNIQPSSYLNSPERKYTDIGYRDALIKANKNIKESCSFFTYVKKENGVYRQYGGMNNGKYHKSSVDKSEQYIFSKTFKAF